jgi:hypothetical protein
MYHCHCVELVEHIGWNCSIRRWCCGLNVEPDLSGVLVVGAKSGTGLQCSHSTLGIYLNLKEWDVNTKELPRCRRGVL